MYGGSAYAAVPYAGGSAATTPAGPVLPGLGDAAYLLVGGGVYIEQDFVAPLPQAGTHRYVVALVYPTPTLVDGRPT